MKTIYVFLFFMFTSLLGAQQETGVTQLEVVGSAKVSISPDQGELNLTVRNIDLLFGDAINGLEKKTSNVIDQLLKIGFKEDKIRTRNFDVRKNTVYRNNQSIDSGYVSTQEINLEFVNDQNTIAKILTKFASSPTEFDLRFNFRLSEDLKTSVQEQLITLATKDAFKKATLISETANVKLKKIVRINYGNSFDAGMKISNDLQGIAVSLRGTTIISKGFTPTEILYSDDILVIWSLE